MGFALGVTSGVIGFGKYQGDGWMLLGGVIGFGTYQGHGRMLLGGRWIRPIPG